MGYKPQEIAKKFPPACVLNPAAANAEINQIGRSIHHKVSNRMTPLESGGGPIGSNIYREGITADQLLGAGGLPTRYRGQNRAQN
jgi:hypothetical protein